MARRTHWTCRKCGHKTLLRKRKCASCGKLKPKKRVPAHKKVLLELTYEDFIELNGGEFCWIHNRMGLPDPPRTTRLHRDHNHKTGQARGLLCYHCNRWLPDWVTPAQLRAAADYLENFT